MEEEEIPLDTSDPLPSISFAEDEGVETPVDMISFPPSSIPSVLPSRATSNESITVETSSNVHAVADSSTTPPNVTESTTNPLISTITFKNFVDLSPEEESKLYPFLFSNYVFKNLES